MRRSALALIAAVAFGAGGGRAAAFGVIDGLGQHAEHARITRLALTGVGFQRETLAALAGGDGRFGAVGAPDRPNRGLSSVMEAHCDGGDYLRRPDYPQTERAAKARLLACRDWISAHLKAAVSAARDLADTAGLVRRDQTPAAGDCRFSGNDRRGKCRVLENLGLAFHATQDFYAHTNWVDRASPGPIGPRNPPGLGRVGPAAWLEPDSRAEVPDGLISGCFEGFPEWFYCRRNWAPVRVRHDDLTKDTGVIGGPGPWRGTTRRGSHDGNFDRAARAAISDTRRKWSFFTDGLSRALGPTGAASALCPILNDRAETCGGSAGRTRRGG